MSGSAPLGEQKSLVPVDSRREQKNNLVGPCSEDNSRDTPATSDEPDLMRRRRSSCVSPGVANVGDNGGRLYVVETPSEARHRRSGRRTGRRCRLGSKQHGADQRRRIIRLHSRAAGEAGKEAWRARSSIGMTAGAIVFVNRLTGHACVHRGRQEIGGFALAAGLRLNR